MHPYFVTNHFKFFEKIVQTKRLEMANIINSEISKFKIFDLLDVGTTSDKNFKSSNMVTSNITNVEIFKSLSDQDIDAKLFSIKFKKSITDNFSDNELNEMKADLVISAATIEHVGSNDNQIKMIDNCSKLSKKIFVITTPNRFYPIDFHTKIPIIHWLPKKYHRKILKIIGLKAYSLEENLNLLSENDLMNFFKKFSNKIKFKLLKIKLLGIASNFIIIGEHL